MVSGFVASVKGKEIAGKIDVAKVTNSQRINDPLVNIWMIAEKCPSQLSSGKIFWKLLTVKQQTGVQDLATAAFSLNFTCQCRVTCQEMCSKTTISISIDNSQCKNERYRQCKNIVIRGFISACLKHVVKLMVWHSASFTVFGSISSPLVSAMDA